MATSPRILLIGGNPRHFMAAKASGLEVVYCQLPEEYKPEYGLLIEGAILTDYTNWSTFEPLVRAAHEAWGFSWVASLTEPGLDPAGKVSDLFGFGGTSYEVSHRFTDKYLMRQRLAEVAPPGLPVVGTAAVTDRDSLADFGARYGYPFVAKPMRGTASHGVHVVHSESEVDDVWAEILRLREDSSHPLATGYDLDDYLMEEFADGPVYSAEAFSFDGRHTVIGITEAITDEPTLVGFGHAMPARIDRATEESIADAVAKFLDAMGYRDGPSHTELKVGRRGVVIIESQNRIGGALINEMVLEVYGVDLHELAMGWPHRLVDPVTARPGATGAAASWLVVAEPGEIVEIGGLDGVQSDPGTLAVDLPIAVGDVVRRLDGSWDGLGHVAVRAGDTETAIELSRAKVADIKIRTRGRLRHGEDQVPA
jgi:ATP-grasp domain/L-amino acid ligase C-terminal domain 2